MRFAKERSLDVESAEREHRAVHVAVRAMLVLPGGAVVAAAAATAVQREIVEQEGVLMNLELRGVKGPVVEVRKARIESLRAQLVEREAALAELPAEAKTDPFQAVNGGYEALNGVRASGELDLIRKSAASVARLEAEWRGVVAQRAALQAEIQEASQRACHALGVAFSSAFKMQGEKMGSLTADPAYVSAPELLPIKELQAAWREAGQLLEMMRLAAPDLGWMNPEEVLLAAIPAPLHGVVRQAWGLAPARQSA